MKKELIKITTGYSLIEGDILNVMHNNSNKEMIVQGIRNGILEMRDLFGNSEYVYNDSLIRVKPTLTPFKIIGVDINADKEPFTGWNFISHNNLPEKMKPCIFKGNGKKITGWIDKFNKVFSTHGSFDPLEFKYYKLIN